MIPLKAIQATCDEIVREFSPLQVILFGSYAYGTPTAESDVDLFVVMEEKRQAWEMRERIPRRFPTGFTRLVPERHRVSRGA